MSWNIGGGQPESVPEFGGLVIFYLFIFPLSAMQSTKKSCPLLRWHVNGGLSYVPAGRELTISCASPDRAGLFPGGGGLTIPPHP